MESLETKIKLYNELQEVFNNKVISLGPVRCDRLTELLGVFTISPINKDTIKIFEDNCCTLDEISVSVMKHKINNFKAYKIYGTFLNSAVKDKDSASIIKRLIMLVNDCARYNIRSEKEFDINEYIYEYQTELRGELIRNMNELTYESNPDKSYYDSMQDTEILTNTLKAILASFTLNDLDEEEIIEIAKININTLFPYDKNVVNRIAEYFDLKEFGWEDK
nr:MAG TPA: hypothetical protein [Caudoviricetes sp.]